MKNASFDEALKKGTFLLVCFGETYSAEIVKGPDLLGKMLEALFGTVGQASPDDWKSYQDDLEEQDNWNYDQDHGPTLWSTDVGETDHMDIYLITDGLPVVKGKSPTFMDTNEILKAIKQAQVDQVAGALSDRLTRDTLFAAACAWLDHWVRKPDEVVYPMSGAQLIAQERERQINKEGWTPEHDDAHVFGEMASAAIVYCDAAEALVRGDKDISGMPSYYMQAGLSKQWPWAVEWLKINSDPIRNLAKAGALIAAEIDRLQRLAGVNNTTVRDGGPLAPESTLKANLPFVGPTSPT